MSFILGQKFKMSQIWKGDRVTPVTIVKAEPNIVNLIRNKEKDGYEALQLKLPIKKKWIKKEFKVKSIGDIKIGDAVSVEQFKEGDIVRVSGISKGRGFAGVVKRHNFGGGPKTHGQKNRFRAPGSIGSTAPQRVIKGRKMAGHYGVERITVKNLKIVDIDKENNFLFIKGAVPGGKGAFLEISKVKI